METPVPNPTPNLNPASAPVPAPPTDPSTTDRDRDLVTLGELEEEFTELEQELERVDRPGADSAGPEAPVS